MSIYSFLIDLIITVSTTERFAAQGLWGRGIYFADKASYSKNYSHTPVKSQTSGRPGPKQGELEMFLTRLLVGETIFADIGLPILGVISSANIPFVKHTGKEVKLNQDRSLTVPPIDTMTGLKYNSVTGHTAGSQVWIVYENGRAYPEYLVRYYVGSRDKSRSPYESKIEASKSAKWSSSTRFELDVSTSNSQPSTSQSTARQGFWEYLSETGWVAYDATNQALIEKTFQDFSSGATLLSIVFINGPEWKYEVDVAKMIQKNTQHSLSTERAIRFNSPFVSWKTIISQK